MYDGEVDEYAEGISINKTFVIYGDGFTINANNSGRIFNVGTEGKLIINNLNLANASMALLNEGNLMIEDSMITDEGEIIVNNGILTITDVVADSNLFITNNGVITEGVVVTVLDNSTIYSTRSVEFYLWAYVTVEDILIKGGELNFIINDTMVPAYFDNDFMCFEKDYVINFTGTQVVTAVYDGALSYDVENGIISSTLGNSFTDLNDTINNHLANDVINLDVDYLFDPNTDDAFVDGIIINRNIVINGNKHVIDGYEQSRIFNIVVDGSLTINNVTLTNANKSLLNNGNLIMNSSKIRFDGEMVFNNGFLALEDISAKNNYITNNGTLNDAVITVLDNSTVKTTIGFKVLLYANVTTDDILVKGGNLEFIVNDTKFVGVFNSSSDRFEYLYTVDFTGKNVVGVNYTALKSNIKTSSILSTTGNSFYDLNELIVNSSVVDLNKDYVFDPNTDGAFVDGILIDKTVVINGNGKTIDAKGQARIFNVGTNGDLTVNNATLINASKALFNKGNLLLKIL